MILSEWGGWVLESMENSILFFLNTSLSDEGRTQNNNKNTLATKEAIRNAAYKTCVLRSGKCGPNI